MTYEAIDQSQFVAAAYAIGIAGTLLTIAWSWIAMRRAEARRERSREL
jgi:nitrate reductase gamma subunit